MDHWIAEKEDDAVNQIFDWESTKCFNLKSHTNKWNCINHGYNNNEQGKSFVVCVQIAMCSWCQDLIYWCVLIILGEGLKMCE